MTDAGIMSPSTPAHICRDQGMGAREAFEECGILINPDWYTAAVIILVLMLGLCVLYHAYLLGRWHELKCLQDALDRGRHP